MRGSRALWTATLVAAATAARGGAPPERDPARTLDENVRAMQHHCLAEIKRAEALAPGSEERGRLLADLIAYMDRQRELFEGDDVLGVVLWLRYALGRARALAGDAPGAVRELDVVIEEGLNLLGEGRDDFLDELRLSAFHLKAKTAFEAGDYELCISAADNMFAPVTGYGWPHSDDRANAVAIYRAKALLSRKRPDPARAAEQCKRVIREGRGAWPNNARQLLYGILVEHSRSLPPLLADAALLNEAALGAYQLALDAAPAEERSRLLDESVRLYQAAVSACRGGGVDVVARLEQEPRAWLEMGIAYSKLELWCESMSCFEKVTTEFAPERVGRALAGRPGRAWERFLEDEGLDPRAAAEGGLARRFHERSRGTPELARVLGALEGRVRKSARNRLVAARRLLAASRLASERELAGRLVQEALARLPEAPAVRAPEDRGRPEASPGDKRPPDDDDMVF